MRKINIPVPSLVSMTILKCGLPVVSAALLYIAAAQSSLNAYDAARLHTLFYEQMEHVLMSLALVVCGALMFDIAMRDKNGSKK